MVGKFKCGGNHKIVWIFLKKIYLGLQSAHFKSTLYISTIFLTNETSSSPLVYLTIVVRDQQKLIVCIIYDVCLCLGAAAVLHKSFYVTYIFLLSCHNDVGWEHPREWVVETQRGFLELAKRVLPSKSATALSLLRCYIKSMDYIKTVRILQ